MIPSAFALIVLLAGVVLIHFGLKEITTQLGLITITPAPFVQSGVAEGSR